MQSKIACKWFYKSFFAVCWWCIFERKDLHNDENIVVCATYMVNILERKSNENEKGRKIDINFPLFYTVVQQNARGKTTKLVINMFPFLQYI